MAATSRGIDVSSYQGAQDWAALARGGLTFVQVKASEGERTHDDRYRMHMDGILAVPSLLPGAYHYAHPNQDAHAEADNYISAVQHDADAHPAFVHWLDLERRTDGANYTGRTSGQIRAWAEAWIDRVRAAHPRQRVGCYTSAADIAAGRYPRNSDALWYPAYPAGAMTYTQAEQRTRPAPSGVKALFWQFTSTPIDRSICYLTPAALRAWAGATVQEDDMPSAQEIAAAVAAYPLVSPTSGEKHSLATFVRYQDQHYAAIMQRLAAMDATISTLAGLVGKGKDVETIVAAVQAAIADATVRVDVAVTGAPPAQAPSPAKS